MIALDNSEAMRNGDYAPTRFQAQADAVNLLCGAKTQVRADVPRGRASPEGVALVCGGITRQLLSLAAPNSRQECSIGSREGGKLFLLRVV